MPPELIAFCAVAAVLVVTPGPDMALVARNALVAGRTAVPVTVLGICAGIVVHALAAAIGLSALLKASATAYAVVKVAGGAYLVYLGVQAWRASYTAEGADEDWMLGPAKRLVGTVTRPSGDFDGTAAFRQGFISNVLNPKLVVFFISVLPGFTSGDGSFFLQVLVLGIAFEALTLIWLLFYGNAVARIGEAMRAPWVRHFLERLSGTVLIALGLKIAYDGAREL
jgi:threonine/homoserine/homoserine lactone efflux protein